MSVQIKSKAINVNGIFIFLLVVLVLKRGGNPFLFNRKLSCFTGLAQKGLGFIKAPWDVGDIRPVSGAGIRKDVSAFGGNLCA